MEAEPYRDNLFTLDLLRSFRDKVQVFLRKKKDGGGTFDHNTLRT